MKKVFVFLIYVFISIAGNSQILLVDRPNFSNIELLEDLVRLDSCIIYQKFSNIQFIVDFEEPTNTEIMKAFDKNVWVEVDTNTYDFVFATSVFVETGYETIELYRVNFEDFNNSILVQKYNQRYSNFQNLNYHKGYWYSDNLNDSIAPEYSSELFLVPFIDAIKLGYFYNDQFGKVIKSDWKKTELSLVLYEQSDPVDIADLSEILTLALYTKMDSINKSNMVLLQEHGYKNGSLDKVILTKEYLYQNGRRIMKSVSFDFDSEQQFNSRGLYLNIGKINSDDLSKRNKKKLKDVNIRYVYWDRYKYEIQ